MALISEHQVDTTADMQLIAQLKKEIVHLILINFPQ
jgi:hypothetical protein